MSDEWSEKSVPWITKDGLLDVAKLPFEGNLMQAMASDGKDSSFSYWMRGKFRAAAARFDDLPADWL